MRLIDADAFKKYIDAQEGRTFIGCTVGEALKIMVGEQHTVEAEPRWIPCSERLPEESGKYFVTVLDGIGKRTTSAPYHLRSKSWTLTGRMAYWKVIAWMPLPEPYRGGEK